MTLISLLIFLVIAGVCLALLPLEETIKRIIVVIVVLVALYWLLTGFGVLPAVRFR